MREQQNYRAAIYCRLSSEDGADHESMSIGNQRALLTEYVEKQGWEVVDTYIDESIILGLRQEVLVPQGFPGLVLFLCGPRTGGPYRRMIAKCGGS